jgi:hypothetical protein
MQCRVGMYLRPEKHTAYLGIVYKSKARRDSRQQFIENIIFGKERDVNEKNTENKPP